MQLFFYTWFEFWFFGVLEYNFDWVSRGIWIGDVVSNFYFDVIFDSYRKWNVVDSILLEMFLMLMIANEIKTSDCLRFEKILKLKMLSELPKLTF